MPVEIDVPEKMGCSSSIEVPVLHHESLELQVLQGRRCEHDHDETVLLLRAILRAMQVR